MHVVGVCVFQHVVPHRFEQCLLGVLDGFQVVPQQLRVQLQHGLDEHAQRQVDQLELSLGEPHGHVLREDVVGQLHVVDAVSRVPCQLCIVEVSVAFADGVQHLVALDAHAHALGLRLEAVCLVVRVQGS